MVWAGLSRKDGGIPRGLVWCTSGPRLLFSAAIVVLERLAHTDADLLPADLRLGLFELPDLPDAQSVRKVAEPPAGWERNEMWSRRTGDQWLRSASTCLLAVPSVILPEETNYAFNPVHPAARLLHQLGERAFSFDPRLI